MSKTLVDLAKISQMLDSGWTVRLFKNSMGSYSAEARHDKPEMVRRANDILGRMLKDSGFTDEMVADILEQDRIETDDFTPEAALSRLSYKVHGEILEAEARP